jgi:hypothetical protein
MLLAFKALFDKVWGYLAIAGVLILAVLGYGAKQRSDGAAAHRDKVNKETQDVEKKWAEIDSRSPSVDDALDRLRRNNKD